MTVLTLLGHDDEGTVLSDELILHDVSMRTLESKSLRNGLIDSAVTEVKA